MNFANPTPTPILSNGSMTQSWLNWFNLAHASVISVRQSGTTAQRPTEGLWIGRRYFDTDLGSPVWVQSVNPTVWVAGSGGGGVGPAGPAGPTGPTGPTGATGPAGASATPLTATITVASPVTYSETVIASVGATTSSKVRASLALRTDAENDIEHAADIGLNLFAQPEVDQIRFVLTADSRFTGPIPIIYEIAL